MKTKRMTSKEIKIGTVLIKIFDDARYLETIFLDDLYVPATPNFDKDSLKLAEELGYGTDTWAMSRDHEIAHTWLAYKRGKNYSPTLYKVARQQAGLPTEYCISDKEVAFEESVVLEFQKQLDKDKPRPWE